MSMSENSIAGLEMKCIKPPITRTKPMGVTEEYLEVCWHILTNH